MPLDGLRIVVVAGLTDPLVLDPGSLATLFMSDVRVTAHEENNGSTNSSLVRCESNGALVVHRPEAAATATVGS